MSCAFVFIRSRHGGDDARRRYETAARFSPLVPESTWLQKVSENAICAAFSDAEESAAGSYVHAPEKPGPILVFNGWVAGNGLSGQPFSSPVASWISERIQSTSFEDFVRDTTGEWSVLSYSAQGDLQAALAFPGGEHLYYGVLDGVFVVSNRAILCAVALHGHVPTPNPFFLGWLITKNNAFLSDDETPFAHVHTLHPLRTLHLHHNAKEFALAPRPWPKTDAVISYDTLLDEMADRVRIVQRLSNLPFRLSLTGGRDSRLVLAALVKAQCFDKLRSCYLIAHPDNPDAVVGKMLAEHYGVSFECMQREATVRSVWEDLAIHQFQTEMGVHFYDNKGVLTKLREGRMGGAYGELFFSHFKWHQLFGWRGVASVLEGNGYVDPENIMTARARDHFRSGIRTFCERRRDDGVLPEQIRDRLHRDGRMWRWVGQGRQAVGLGAVNTNPIASPQMLDTYVALPYLDRRFGRLHYELLRRADPWILDQPYASKGFSRYLTGKTQRRMAFPAAARIVSPQHALWKSQRDELVNYLLAPSKGGFFELIDKKRLETRLRRVPTNPARGELASILGILGLRHALEEPIEPRPCKVDPA